VTAQNPSQNTGVSTPDASTRKAKVEAARAYLGHVAYASDPALSWLPLRALVAFVAEHQRCVDLESGTDNGFVWIHCSCGRLIMPPVDAPSRNPAAAWPA